MAYKSTPTRFYLGYVPDATTTEVYEVVDDGAILTFINFYNNNATPETIEIWVVPTGESVGDEYKISQGNLATVSNSDLSPLKGMVLSPGDKIYIQTTTADKVTCYLSGVILTDV